MLTDRPINRFKQAILAGRQQIGCWCTLASPYSAEVMAGAGFDWLVFDTEHSPSDLEQVLGLLQAASAYPVSAVVRPPANDAVVIKRYLDIGAQTLLIPYVQTADEARAAVAAVRYPPEGIRGYSALTRASRFGRLPDYAPRASEDICLLVQVETEASLDQIEAIAAIEGIDGIFIGPGDLAASMGHVGDLGNPRVKAAVEGAIARIKRTGKPPGVLTGDLAFAQRCMDAGAVFTAIGSDMALLARGADALAKQFPRG